MGLIKEFINKKRISNLKKPRNTGHIGSLCIENLSGYYQLDYSIPDIIKDFMKNGSRNIEEIIKKTKADSFNDSMLDQYICELILLAKDDIDSQRLSHDRAIKDIHRAQTSKVQAYKREVERIDMEMAQLREEVI